MILKEGDSFLRCKDVLALLGPDLTGTNYGDGVVSNRCQGRKRLEEASFCMDGAYIRGEGAGWSAASV